MDSEINKNNFIEISLILQENQEQLYFNQIAIIKDSNMLNVGTHTLKLNPVLRDSKQDIKITFEITF